LADLAVDYNRSISSFPERRNEGFLHCGAVFLVFQTGKTLLPSLYLFPDSGAGLLPYYLPPPENLSLLDTFMSENRPNILFAIADDASHFGCYGHSFVKTPHCDRVARDGVRFNNMFTTNPKCAPSRASIVTGMHTWQLKEACNHWNVFPGPDEFDVYPDLLMDAGYHVGHRQGLGPR
jgi:hypothetical protein